MKVFTDLEHVMAEEQRKRKIWRRRRRTDHHLVRVDVGEVVEHDLEVGESGGEGDADGEGAAGGLQHHEADRPLARHDTVVNLG